MLNSMLLVLFSHINLASIITVRKAESES